MTGTAVSTRPSNTAAAVRQNERASQLRESLARYHARIAEVLPKHLTPERLVTLTLVAATKTPKLFDCSVESVALALIRVAQWGLEIGVTAHLVPFNTKVGDKWVTTCTPIADYKGLILMIERGKVARD